VALLLTQPGWATAGPTYIMSYLKSHSRADAFTGALPNDTWGSGKLDARIALPSVPSLRFISPARGSTYTSAYGRSDLLSSGGSFDSIRVWLSLDACNYDQYVTTMRAPFRNPIQVLFAGRDTTSSARLRAIGYRGTTRVDVFSDGLFTLNHPMPTGVAGEEQPLSFTVRPNRPNPFNPKTDISFDVPERERVTVRVYSTDGRLVRRLLDNELGPGRYGTSWDGTNGSGAAVSSGIYFFEVIAGSERASRRMTLIR